MSLLLCSGKYCFNSVPFPILDVPPAESLIAEDNGRFITFSHNQLLTACSFGRVFVMCKAEADVPASECPTLKELLAQVKQSC